MYTLVYCLLSGGLSECEEITFDNIDLVKDWLTERIETRGLFDFIGYGNSYTKRSRSITRDYDGM